MITPSVTLLAVTRLNVIAHCGALTNPYDPRRNILRTLCLLFGIALSLGTVLQKTAPMSHFKGKVGDSSGP
ncbi:MAG: hypothetical protein K0U58_07455, partial [Gammaproteobacteria bacterium]|nr:hypothetical protein [Gammaproteobacteria bacterium]